MRINSLGTLLMARSGRRTRTVLTADRLTLCPSSEYSSILQRGGREGSHRCVTGILITGLTLANPERLQGIQQNAQSLGHIAFKLPITEVPISQDRMMPLSFRKAVSHTHWRSHTFPSKHIQACAHTRTHARLTFNWH